MTRAFLVAAMAISLWPLGVVLMISDGGNDSSVSQPPAAPRDGKPPYVSSGLKEFASRAHELNEDLGDGELYAGEPRYDLTYQAQEIEAELLLWRRYSKSETSRAEDRVAQSLVDLMQAAVDLTEYPSQMTLRVYNRALRHFNVAIRMR